MEADASARAALKRATEANDLQSQATPVHRRKMSLDGTEPILFDGHSKIIDGITDGKIVDQL